VLRAILLYLSKASWAHHIVTRWGFARRAASRFIAGDTLEEAITTVGTLNQAGKYATLDHLGENVNSPDEAIRATDEYLEIIARLCAANLRSNISVKLTQLGLNVDLDQCRANLHAIAARAAECGMLVRVDIEDSPTIDNTFALYRQLRDAGLTNIGLAIQAYLYRSEVDLQELLPLGARFRLCKGAYKEPPELAFPKKADVDANYDRLSALLIDSALASGAVPASEDGQVPPVAAIATHDEARVQFAQDYAQRVGFPKAALEFQMLLGIRTDLQERLTERGYPVRIYIPFGTQWYPYFVRRLAERPANLWFFLSNLFRR
jgi:proline dehydrogenase